MQQRRWHRYWSDPALEYSINCSTRSVEEGIPKRSLGTRNIYEENVFRRGTLIVASHPIGGGDSMSIGYFIA